MEAHKFISTGIQLQDLLEEGEKKLDLFYEFKNTMEKQDEILMSKTEDTEMSNLETELQ